MPFNNQSNSINQKVAVTEEYEKMSPYFIRQSQQQQQVMNSQTQQKRKAQQIIEQIEVSGQNPYSRNQVQDQIKTTYSQ